MTGKSNIVEQPSPVVNFNDYLEGLQADFRQSLSSESRPKIVGTLCLSSPLELIDAVGAVPLRIMDASAEAELRGGRFLASDSCSFCKSTLGALDLRSTPYDAVLGSTTCDQMRRNLEIIARDLHLPLFVFNAPRTAEQELSRNFARREMQRLSVEISAWTQIELREEAVAKALRRRAEARQRLRTLQPLTQTEQPLITGGQFLALLRFYQTVSLDYFLTHLTTLESELSRRASPYRQPPLRLALLGSCVGRGDDQILNLIEESGQASIVYTSVCTGSRALRDESPLPDDPFAALVSLYHDQVFCPFHRPNDRLFEAVSTEVKNLRVQGIIYKTLKFCHSWGFEARRFKELLGLPFLALDHDYSPSAEGQLRTRIAAFLEQLSSRR